MKKVARLLVLALLILVLCGVSTISAEIIKPKGMGQIGLSSVVLCDSLTVRKRASSSAKAVATLHYGDRPIVIEQSNGWAYCALDDSEDSLVGWIKADYLAIDPAWYRTERTTTVYAWDDKKAPKVAQLKRNTSLPILKEDGDWLIVSLRGAVGYIHK